jgi:hypothetical protein
MSEVEKTSIFWLGIIMFGLSLTILFTSVWIPYGIIWDYHVGFNANNRVSGEPFVPWTFGSVVFMFIGSYMIKCGTKKKEVRKTQPPNK